MLDAFAPAGGVPLMCVRTVPAMVADGSRRWHRIRDVSNHPRF